VDSKDTAENIATWMQDKDEHITALKMVLGKEMTPAQLSALERRVRGEIARARSLPSYVQSLSQFQRELDDAKDDNVRLRLLYERFLGQSDVGQF
jgi:hypothetical protein